MRGLVGSVIFKVRDHREASNLLSQTCLDPCTLSETSNLLLRNFLLVINVLKCKNTQFLSSLPVTDTIKLFLFGEEQCGNTYFPFSTETCAKKRHPKSVWDQRLPLEERELQKSGEQ